MRTSGQYPTRCGSVRCGWSSDRAGVRRSGRRSRGGREAGRKAETVRRGSAGRRSTRVARPGLTRGELAEFKRLKRENAELRRANEILKAASGFFAAELDRPAATLVTSSRAPQAPGCGVEPICTVLPSAGSPRRPTRAARRPSRPGRCATSELQGRDRPGAARRTRRLRRRKVWPSSTGKASAVARCTVERLMRDIGLAGRARQAAPCAPRPGAARCAACRPGRAPVPGRGAEPAVGGGLDLRDDLVRAGCTSRSSSMCSPAGSWAGGPPRRCAPTWPWTRSSRRSGPAAATAHDLDGPDASLRPRRAGRIQPVVATPRSRRC